LAAKKVAPKSNPLLYLFFSFPSTPHAAAAAAAAATLITPTWNTPSLVRFIFLLIVPFFYGYGGGLEKKDRALFLFVREREGEGRKGEEEPWKVLLFLSLSS
jgi:hypothetical protein